MEHPRTRTCWLPVKFQGIRRRTPEPQRNLPSELVEFVVNRPAWIGQDGQLQTTAFESGDQYAKALVLMAADIGRVESHASA